MTPSSSLLDEPISAEMLGKAFGVSSRQARAVLDRAGAERVKGKGYQLASVLEALYRRRVEQDSRAASLAAADARLREAQADLRELEVEKRRGGLVTLASEVVIINGVLSELGRMLQALPPRAAPQLEHVSAREALHVLRAEVDGVLHRMARGFERLAAGLGANAERGKRKVNRKGKRKP